MKTLASLFAASLVFAALAPSAAGKEIKSAKVCGPSECMTVTDRDQAMVLINSSHPGSPPPAASFYTVEVEVAVEAGRAVAWTFYYVPSAQMTRSAYAPDGEAGPSVPAWSTVPGATSAFFREVTKGMEPFPKPDLSSVGIGSRTVVAGADSYLRLFELPPTRASGSLPTEYSAAIDLRSKQPTPWTDMPSDLSYSPAAGMLERGGQVVRLPDELRADLQAGRPLAGEEAAAPSAGFPSGTFTGALAAALAAAVAIALALRRFGFPFPRRRPSAA